MNFQRKQKIENELAPRRILMIYGPRRIGKTTMVKEYLASISKDKKVKYDIGDDISLQQLLGKQERAPILDYVRPYDVIVIDEAQHIPNIGIAAKIMIDEFPEKIIILTGSSSFTLSQHVGEPLTGRQYQINLLPLAQNEIYKNAYEKKQALENTLLFGSYPEVLLVDDRLEKEKVLRELISSYLFKDILSFEHLRSPELLLKITKALAFQIGNEVSINKLAKDVGENDPKKVARYLDLLEKSFIIKRVSAFSKNPRNEIRKKMKYYFYDMGLRNAVIDRFQVLSNRDNKEIGGMWENFAFMELYKKYLFKNNYFTGVYFWRSIKGHEVDIIIENGNELLAFECKWSMQTVVFTEYKKAYPHSITNVISRENFTDFF